MGAGRKLWLPLVGQEASVAGPGIINACSTNGIQLSHDPALAYGDTFAAWPKHAR